MHKNKNKISKVNKKKESEKGFSLLEVLPLIIVITSLFAFLIGLWGMTHKHILHSISSRSYAFETFRNRANVTYFNDTRSETNSYEESGLRFHASGDGAGNTIRALVTPIRFPATEERDNQSTEYHRRQIFNESVIPAQGEGTGDGTVLPWVMVAHGICVNAGCGEGN